MPTFRADDERAKAEQLAAPVAVASTRLSMVLAGRSHITYRDVHIPGVGPAKVRLLSRNEEAEVEAALMRWLAHLGTEGVTPSIISSVHGLPISSEQAVRIVAIATRDPEDPRKPIGTFEEWRELSDTQIGAAYDAWEDLTEELHPLSQPLSEAEHAAIRAAIAEKKTALLAAFGARRLARFLLTTGDPPAS